MDRDAIDPRAYGGARNRTHPAHTGAPKHYRSYPEGQPRHVDESQRPALAQITQRCIDVVLEHGCISDWRLVNYVYGL